MRLGCPECRPRFATEEVSTERELMLGPQSPRGGMIVKRFWGVLKVILVIPNGTWKS
jgi:hypothetical protein